MGDAFSRKDLTAQGVAKIRLTENMFAEDQQLFCDPYAKHCVIGGWIMIHGVDGCEHVQGSA